MLKIFKKSIHKLFERIYIIGKIRYQERIYEKYREKFQVHPSFRFNGENIEFYGDGEIICKKESYIGSYSTVQAFDKCKVLIGEKCAISHNVKIYTQSYKSDQNFASIQTEIKTGNVIIGNYAWIGANVFINPGITIRENVIIGANSVVTKDIPDNAIAGGVPARIICYKNFNSHPPLNIQSE